jgi:hypothetical protein
VITDTGDTRIRVVGKSTGTYDGVAMTAGDIYTVAGSGTGGLGDRGPAAAILNAPDGVAADSSGNLLIADTGDNRVRAVTG